MMFFDILNKLTKKEFDFSDEEIEEALPYLKYVSAADAPIELWQRILTHAPVDQRGVILQSELVALCKKGDAETFNAMLALAQQEGGTCLQEVLYKDGFSLFRAACESKHAEMVKALGEAAKSLGGGWLQNMLASTGKDVSRSYDSQEYGAFQDAGSSLVIKELASFARQTGHLADMLRSNDYFAFRRAPEKSKTAKRLKLLVTLGKEAGYLPDMLKAHDYEVFKMACTRHNTEALEVLIGLAKEQRRLPQMLAADNYSSFLRAIDSKDQATVDRLLLLAKELHCLPDMLRSNVYGGFSRACRMGNIDAMHSLISVARELKGNELKKMLSAASFTCLSNTCEEHPRARFDAMMLLLNLLKEEGMLAVAMKSDNLRGNYKPMAIKILDVLCDHTQKQMVNDVLESLEPALLKDCLRGNTKIAQVLSGETLPTPAYPEEPPDHYEAMVHYHHRRRLERPGEPKNWQQVARIDPPHPSLLTHQPFGFKPKLYEELLPVMQLASKAEGNETPELHAYKLAVLFANAEEAERYLDRYFKEWKRDVKQPVHDALLFSFPEEGKWSIPKWKDMLLKHGPLVSKNIPRAVAIEGWLEEHKQPFPTSPAQLNDVGAQIAYVRAKENPEFARLANQCGLSEDGFNDVLDILKAQAKTKDHLPDISIDGAEIGLPNYYMEKLKPNDPTGFVLGLLTNCCQYIGGTGSDCAEHGMTSENGGFYVWKHKTKGRRTDNDTIVAQSWAWIGTDNALVFDSFERLSSEYDACVAPFMEQFAYETLEKHHFQRDGKDMSISAIKLGKGGGTPDLPYKTPFAFHSKPLDHNGYSDSKTQYIVPTINHKSAGKQFAPDIRAQRNDSEIGLQ